MARKKVARPKRIRAGATHLEIFNSGLEVWLYDEANLDDLNKKKTWRKLVDGHASGGTLVGYSLWQDDELTIDVVVGKPLTDKELSVARWLEPQHAFLRLPSGKLVIESNDSYRVFARSWKEGAKLKPPAGPKLDATMDDLGLKPLGDFTFDLDNNGEDIEFTVRTWVGAAPFFAAAWASVDSFEVFFLTRAGGRWLMTGTIDEADAFNITAARPRLSMQCADDTSLADLAALHRKRLKAAKGKADPIPASLEKLVELYDDYVEAAVG